MLRATVLQAQNNISPVCVATIAEPSGKRLSRLRTIVAEQRDVIVAVGAIGVKEPIKEISARHFSGNEAPIKGAAVFGDVNVTSPEPPTTPPGLLFGKCAQKCHVCVSSDTLNWFLQCRERWKR